MPRYRVTTPDTDRVPGKDYANFERAQECTNTDDVGNIIRRHGFEGCSVWRKERHHWELIFDTSLPRDCLPGSMYWLNVAQNEYLR